MSLLCEGNYVLEKFPGKGGWTYVLLPEVAPDKSNPFGWVQVRGFINSYEITHYKLMPYGKGMLFLPVKAEIRRKFNVKEGDSIYVKLWKDDLPAEIPQEIIDCLHHESPEVQSRFNALSEGQRMAFVNWIYSAKNDDTRVQRIVEMMRKLERGEDLYFRKTRN